MRFIQEVLVNKGNCFPPRPPRETTPFKLTSFHTISFSISFSFSLTPSGTKYDSIQLKKEYPTMKNKWLVLLLSFFLTGSLFAQDRAESPSAGFSSLTEAGKMAEAIVEAAGVPANFAIMEANVPNAAAVVQNGRRYILYNPAFINVLTKATGTKWAAISVLAHEIGHHLYSPSVNKGKIPLATELEADEFSGHVLRKMGATLDEAQSAMQILATTKATRTHPAGQDRLLSIANGWNNADGNKTDNTTAIARTTTTGTSAVLPDQQILASIRFNADPRSEYYVTTRYNVVKVENNQLQRIGKLTKLDSEDYPYMIYDEQGNRVFVEASGRIVTSRGTNVGKLDPRS
jgi:hypothetical protein